MDGFAERVVLDVELTRRIAARVALIEQVLSLPHDVGVQHAAAARGPRSIEGLDSLFAILFDASFDADGTDAEGLDDLDLFAGPLANELSGEHAKGIAVVRGMSEDGPGTVEPSPLAVLVDDANEIIDRSSPVGDERQ